MSDTNAEKYKLYKIALWMEKNRDYVVPEGLLPQKYACAEEFQQAAYDFGNEFYLSDLIEEIKNDAVAHPELAKSILEHLSTFGSRAAKAGNQNQKLAAGALRDIQESFSLELAIA